MLTRPSCCRYYYKVTRKSDVKSDDMRRRAFEMYLEGMCFRAIGRVLGISYSTILLLYKELRN